VAGSPRSDDDKAGTPLAGLSCSCWVLHKPIEKSSAWGQKTPYYNRPTQDGLRGHFVLRAIGKRFRKDRTAGCEKVVGIRFALDSSLEGGGFELSVPGDGQSRCSRFCAARLLGMDRRTGAGVPRFSSIIMRGKPSTMPPHTRGVNCMYTP